MPMSFLPGASSESATVGSRRTFRTLRCSNRWPETISSPSRPIQTIVTCGLPSVFSVTRCARGPDSISARRRSGSGAIRAEVYAASGGDPRIREGVVEDLERVLAAGLQLQLLAGAGVVDDDGQLI